MAAQRRTKCSLCGARVTLDDGLRVLRHRDAVSGRVCAASGKPSMKFGHDIRIEPTGMCPSGKMRFADRYTAMMAISQARSKRGRGNERRQESRVYECTIQECGKGWHMTSETYRAT